MAIAVGCEKLLKGFKIPPTLERETLSTTSDDDNSGSANVYFRDSEGEKKFNYKARGQFQFENIHFYLHIFLLPYFFIFKNNFSIN